MRRKDVCQLRQALVRVAVEVDMVETRDCVQLLGLKSAVHGELAEEQNMGVSTSGHGQRTWRNAVYLGVGNGM